jgi:hypothetical protein
MVAERGSVRFLGTTLHSGNLSGVRIKDIVYLSDPVIMPVLCE